MHIHVFWTIGSPNTWIEKNDVCVDLFLPLGFARRHDSYPLEFLGKCDSFVAPLWIWHEYYSTTALGRMRLVLGEHFAWKVATLPIPRVRAARWNASQTAHLRRTRAPQPHSTGLACFLRLFFFGVSANLIWTYTVRTQPRSPGEEGSGVLHCNW